MNLSIHPETRVGELLDAYPLLEAKLITIAPAFEKLRNPILRKTVAKIATLEQAARIGGVPVRDLVRQLREAAGQPTLPDASPCTAPAPAADPEPSWLASSIIASGDDIDGDLLLAQGIHPLGKVRERVAALSPGQTLRLTTSFRPVPLIEALRGDRIDAYSTAESPTRHLTYFHRR